MSAVRPIRFTVMTYNLWNDQRWAEREPALGAFLQKNAPDLLGIQELRPVSRALLDRLLPDHERVDDPFEGWASEGNLWWHRGMFERVAHGAEEIGMIEKLRRLFWVRLRLRDGSGRTLFLSTAHYTWPGNGAEKEGRALPRHEQARRTLETLTRLVPTEEPLIFMGDLNDDEHPIHRLREGGLMDSSKGLGRQPSPTFPAHPAQGLASPRTIDWIFHRGPIRPMTSESVDFFHKDLTPSDHKPVVATYAL